MPTRWREIGRKCWQVAKRAAPVVISVGLVSWLVWKVSPQHLAAAFTASAWPWLVVATLVQAVVLFLWDTVSMWWLFSQPDRRLPFLTVLRARTDSVIWSAINLEVGQGVFAWTLATELGLPVTATIGRCLVLGLFDFGVLQSLALVGSFLHADPMIRVLRWVPVVSVVGLLALVLAWHALPDRWRQRVVDWQWTRWLSWWSWRHSFWLAAQRLILFLLVLVYAGVCLAICRIPTDAATVVGVIPFVLIAESLPGTGGLGERETALIYLLRPNSEEQQALLLSFGLIWSVVVILARIAISLVSWSLPRRPAPSAEGAGYVICSELTEKSAPHNEPVSRDLPCTQDR